ncbi:MAG: DUF2490 domain-containing protein [Cyclobacteriaceae bacterium]|nr:DUF2490 domain-containing protein [Cyclobacteriaceae bacterium]
MKIKLIIPVIIAGMLFFSPAFSQNLDNELWMDVGASKKLFKNAKLELELAHRRDNNLASTKVFYFEPAFEYEAVKNLSLSVSYRYSIKPNKTNGNRLSFAAQYGFKIIDDLKISYRLKYQSDFDPIDPAEKALRNKIKLAYNLSKKVDPYFAFEMHYNMDALQKEFEQTRLAFGAEIDLPKGHDIAVYYMFRRKFNVKNTGNINTIGIGYSLGNIKGKKGKKGKKGSDN